MGNQGEATKGSCRRRGRLMMQHFTTAGHIGMERHILSFTTIPAVTRIQRITSPGT